MSDLSRNLSWSEVLRGSGYEANECPKDVLGMMFRHAQASWQPVRDQWGDPLSIVNSGGIRSPSMNAQCGGSAKSRHMVGDATDVKLSSRQENHAYLALYDLIDGLQRRKEITPGGLALYFDFKTKRIRFQHFDSRGHIARWNAKHLKAARDYYA